LLQKRGLLNGEKFLYAPQTLSNNCSSCGAVQDVSRRPSPERLAVARVTGIVRRHSGTEPINVHAALEEIRAVPAVSPEVLAEAAGIALGYYHDAQDWSSRIIEGGLLIAAGADLSQLRHWINVGRNRRAEPHHAAR
jgi:hypothetical protein